MILDLTFRSFPGHNTVGLMWMRAGVFGSEFGSERQASASGMVEAAGFDRWRWKWEKFTFNVPKIFATWCC
jgi:hypothetical protein